MLLLLTVNVSSSSTFGQRSCRPEFKSACKPKVAQESIWKLLKKLDGASIELGKHQERQPVMLLVILDYTREINTLAIELEVSHK